MFSFERFSLRFHPEANRQEDFYNIKNRQSITAYSLLRLLLLRISYLSTLGPKM